MGRKEEWSIWMVHLKTQVPHRYLKSGADDSSHHNGPGNNGPRKSSDEVC